MADCVLNCAITGTSKRLQRSKYYICSTRLRCRRSCSTPRRNRRPSDGWSTFAAQPQNPVSQPQNPVSTPQSWHDRDLQRFRRAPGGVRGNGEEPPRVTASMVQRGRQAPVHPEAGPSGTPRWPRRRCRTRVTRTRCSGPCAPRCQAGARVPPHE
jgi:hypothetical protein